MSNKLITQAILFTEHKSANKNIVLEIQINNPEKLHVLNIDILQQLHKQLNLWEKNKDLRAIFIHATGDRAFCAGGDIVQLYQAILTSKNPSQNPDPLVRNFFKTEYEINHRLFHFPKPVIVWGNGFVIGGGMGLFMSSSHSILTENSLLSMPEISIGFFPDVGASYFLNQIPKNIGLYLALTAYKLNASEAHYLGLSSLALNHSQKTNVFDFLLQADYKDTASFDLLFNKQYPLANFISTQHNWIKTFEKDILQTVKHKDIYSFHKHISHMQKEDKKWEKNRQAFLRASPSSLAIIFEQLNRAKQEQQSFKNSLEMEFCIAMRIACNSDFLEGVRAMLVDKDRNPKWNPASIEDLNITKIQEYFTPEASWHCVLDVT